MAKRAISCPATNIKRENFRFRQRNFCDAGVFAGVASALLCFVAFQSRFENDRHRLETAGREHPVWSKGDRRVVASNGNLLRVCCFGHRLRDTPKDTRGIEGSEVAHLPRSIFGRLCPHTLLLGDLLVLNAGPPRRCNQLQSSNAKTFASGDGSIQASLDAHA